MSEMSLTREDSSKVLLPDNPMYIEAVEALKRFHEAEADGVTGAELERLRLIAEHQFLAVTDYQLGALGGPTHRSHERIRLEGREVATMPGQSN